MSTAPRLYLAGPDVFHPDAKDIAIEKKVICEQHGFVGLDPLDSNVYEFETAKGTPKQEIGKLILLANRGLMRQSQGIIANIKPFRGPGADDGTSFEQGFMYAYGAPIACYAHLWPGESQYYNDRGKRYQIDGGARGFQDHQDKTMVEDFDLYCNLMLACSANHLAIRESTNPWRDTAAFEECVIYMKGHFYGAKK